MRYPQLVNSVLYKRLDTNTYKIIDCMTDKEYELGVEAVRFMRQLDGKVNPYNIDSTWSEREVKLFMRFLKDNKLTRISRIERNGLLSLRITLFKINATPNMKAIAWLLNLGLMVSFVPLAIIGALTMYKHIGNLLECENYSIMMVGSVLGLLLGMTMHEFAHAIAGLGLRARVFETGLIIGLTSGAYVLLEHKYVKSLMKRVQILAAGVEMNLALFGVSAMMFGLCKTVSPLFFGMAYTNATLALINLLFITGLDGSQIINELIGSNMFSSTIDFILDRKARENILSQGITGYAKVASCVISIIFQIAYPALIIVNIFSIGSLMI